LRLRVTLELSRGGASGRQLQRVVSQSSDKFAGDSVYGLSLQIRFQLHGANAINLAVNIMIAFNKTDVFYLGSNFNYR